MSRDEEKLYGCEFNKHLHDEEEKEKQKICKKRKHKCSGCERYDDCYHDAIFDDIEDF